MCTFLDSVLTRGSIQSSARRKSELKELQSEDFLRELFNLPSMKPGRDVKEDHSDYNWIFLVFG